MRFREPGYTGHLIEKELFGVPESSKNMPEIEKKFREAGFIKMRDAMSVIKRYQPEGSDPSDPEAGFANDLHATVAELLGIEDYENLRFYTAVGTLIDFKNGVDAFMELDHEGRTYFVTLDVTANPNKTSHKADIVFHVPMDGIDPKEDKREYSEILNGTADRVASKFKDLAGINK